jgi:chloramphenicol 3-O-phosphotransferase
MVNKRYRPPGILLLNGMPGSGKTTVARLIAEQCLKGVHINGDEIHNMVLGGRIHPPGKPEDEEEIKRQLELRERNIALLADSFFKAGFFPVIDNFMSNKERLNHLLMHLKTRPIAMVVLHPRLEVSLERDRVRLEKTVAHLFQDLYGELQKEIAGIGLWLDSSDLTPEQTAQQIQLRAFYEGIIL